MKGPILTFTFHSYRMGGFTQGITNILDNCTLLSHRTVDIPSPLCDLTTGSPLVKPDGVPTSRSQWSGTCRGGRRCRNSGEDHRSMKGFGSHTPRRINGWFTWEYGPPIWGKSSEPKKSFSGSMLIFGGVITCLKVQILWFSRRVYLFKCFDDRVMIPKFKKSFR